VLRDRNHPSIVFWSIGNEIPEVLVERGPAMAKKLSDQVRSLDWRERGGKRAGDTAPDALLKEVLERFAPIFGLGIIEAD